MKIVPASAVAHRRMQSQSAAMTKRLPFGDRAILGIRKIEATV